MMNAAAALSSQRCLNHPPREAVARCPECKQFFCRECVTEHDDRAICAACLKRLARSSAGGRGRMAGLCAAGEMLAGVLMVWFFFYAVGRNLMDVPDSFHEGTIWKATLIDEP